MARSPVFYCPTTGRDRNADRATLSPRIALIEDCNGSKVDVCDQILSVHGALIFPSMATGAGSLARGDKVVELMTLAGLELSPFEGGVGRGAHRCF
jgi:hypothetical protein